MIKSKDYLGPLCRGDSPQLGGSMALSPLSNCQTATAGRKWYRKLLTL